MLLDDGSEARLTGALAPRRPLAGLGAWPPEDDARAALERLVAGRPVELAFGRRKSDRYGRHLAHVFVERDGERIWVQGRMLSLGHARAYGLPQTASCVSELMAHEALARGEGLGLWSTPAYRAMWAGRTFELLRRRGTFQLVEGIVSKVAEVRGRIYVNFGKDWRSDFSVGIAAAVSSSPQRALDLKSLDGARVRVRGWIERRNGPYIELADLALLEVLGRVRPAIAEAAPDVDTGGGPRRPSSVPGSSQSRKSDREAVDL